MREAMMLIITLKQLFFFWFWFLQLFFFREWRLYFCLCQLILKLCLFMKNHENLHKNNLLYTDMWFNNKNMIEIKSIAVCLHIIDKYGQNKLPFWSIIAYPSHKNILPHDITTLNNSYWNFVIFLCTAGWIFF